MVKEGEPHTGVIVSAQTGFIPIRFHFYHLVAASNWGSHSLRTTQGRLITSLMRPPAL